MNKTTFFIALTFVMLGCQPSNSKKKEIFNFNHVKSVELSSNNIDDKITEDRHCNTTVVIEDGFIGVSGYTADKTFFEITSTEKILDSNVYNVKTNQKESYFIFDSKEPAVIWQLVRQDNSGLQVFFTNE